MSRLSKSTVFGVFLWACSAPALAVEQEAEDGPPSGHAVQVIGTEFQLLVDDALIGRKRGVVREVHACEKLERPVIEPEKPWEQKGPDQRIYVYGTVMRDESTGQFRLWYNRNQLVLYATSTDGLKWRRPELGLCEFERSSANNIVFSQLHSPSVVYSPGETDPAKRYNMLGYGRVSGRGYYAAYSADGLRWKWCSENPVLPSGDTCTLALNPKTGEYLAFHKRTLTHRGERRRLVYLATSRDMQEWSEPELVMGPDATDDERVRAEGGLFSQFYNMSVFSYGGQFLGLVTHFRYTGAPPEKGPLQSPDDGPIDVQLVHSRDGRVWHRLEDRSAVIPNGPHAYDAGSILGVSNGPVVVGDQIWFYYTAITTTHGGYVPKKRITIAVAKWRREGFVSLSAGSAEGVIETVPLDCSGDRLTINADASGGQVTVAILDDQGRPAPGYDSTDCIPLEADAVRHTVRWKAHDRVPIDRPLRLRFHLLSAKIFSYGVGK
ncbi:MAG: hypothetical protein HQ582_27230 [Planctomycetes bacterium]|nr:hypothetical protein [Planctomycetota bacterium]